MCDEHDSSGLWFNMHASPVHPHKALAGYLRARAGLVSHSGLLSQATSELSPAFAAKAALPQPHAGPAPGGRGLQCPVRSTLQARMARIG